MLPWLGAPVKSATIRGINMRYEFITYKPGYRFLWTYADLLSAQFARHNLNSHHEYGTVSDITLNLVDEPQLGLIYLGK